MAVLERVFFMYLLFFLYGGTGGTLVLFHTPLSGSRKVFSVLKSVDIALVILGSHTLLVTGRELVFWRLERWCDVRQSY